MKIQWCWRCKMDVPMLSEAEHKLCVDARKEGKSFVEKEIKRRKIENYQWIGELASVPNMLRYYLEMYKVITGYTETNPNAIAHHITSIHGPACPDCSKPLRSNDAGYCASCGFGLNEYKLDLRPLRFRQPHLFDDKAI